MRKAVRPRFKAGREAADYLLGCAVMSLRGAITKKLLWAVGLALVVGLIILLTVRDSGGSQPPWPVSGQPSVSGLHVLVTKIGVPRVSSHGFTEAPDLRVLSTTDRNRDGLSDLVLGYTTSRHAKLEDPAVEILGGPRTASRLRRISRITLKQALKTGLLQPVHYPANAPWSPRPTRIPLGNYSGQGGAGDRAVVKYAHKVHTFPCNESSSCSEGYIAYELRLETTTGQTIYRWGQDWSYFQPSVWNTYPDPPARAYPIGDWNNDGRTDLLFSTLEGSSIILPGPNGSASERPFPSLQADEHGQHFPSPIDLTGDGRDEVVGISPTGTDFIIVSPPAK